MPHTLPVGSTSRSTQARRREASTRSTRKSLEALLQEGTYESICPIHNGTCCRGGGPGLPANGARLQPGEEPFRLKSCRVLLWRRLEHPTSILVADHPAHYH